MEQNEKPLKASNLTFSLKELIATVVFLFTMSGIYYELGFQRKQDRLEFNVLKDDYEANKKTTNLRLDLLGEQMQSLKDKETIRSTKEEISGIIELKKK